MNHQEQQQFYKLLRLSLGLTQEFPVEVDADGWRRLYQTAIRQSLVETFPRFYLVLLRQPIAPMESDGMSRVCIRCNPRNVTKPLNICSDFHLDRHFFGLVGGFFVGLSVTLWLGMIKLL